ncbi:hypothetical protein PTSG_01273 [Salpingoeca rosetta]|uniref:JmjC domain-containing protein n=1 Tax=Salpingoeca rosetta (strain ATCC 50818 / BSB-021) TaxID=946362 RepID=F2TZV5_SALR5|nr:uncharacterized protein PTSG_01273 [Salpingoeca rosetta]EGD80683.1 hypothetical protein PTSG_01273 [Salpingoeca rosetta]|eukprot:XP_004997244.1 hypothetical protein PTSG_01273 [Salpingoeca rosetta]
MMQSAGGGGGGGGGRRGWHKRGLARQPEPCGIVESSPPHGIKPLGAAFLSARNHVQDRNESLGDFAIFGDEELLLVLEYLHPRDLCKLACVSRYLRAFASHDELWQAHCEQLFQARPFSYATNWKTSYMRACARGGCDEVSQGACHDSTSTDSSGSQPPQQSAQPEHHQQGQEQDEEQEQEGHATDLAVYSDYLYSSWFYAAACIDPSWLEEETMPRIELSPAEFQAQYESKQKPVILKGLAKSWPAFKLWPDGGIKSVCPKNTLFKAGTFNVTLDAFDTYSPHQCDQRPLYIFDKHFADKCPQLGQQYSVPEHFSTDLFSSIEGANRPNYRWLIVGPAKSGSTWHKDPNSTAAWNALVEGEKRWIMTPPNYPPPGVYPSPDGSAVATPISVTEWFISYYEALQQSGIPYVEGTQRPGDVVFVPHGWWHVVLNTKPSIAVTQNYAGAPNLFAVLRFIGTKPDQVSGVAQDVNLYEELVHGLRQHHPEMMAVVQRELDTRKRTHKRAHGSRRRVADGNDTIGGTRRDSDDDDDGGGGGADDGDEEHDGLARKKPKGPSVVKPFSFNFAS